MRLLAIDPGKHAIGLSVWDEKLLSVVAYMEFTTLSVLGRDLRLLYCPDVVVCEVPQVYPGFREQDPNDLIDVAVVAGVCLSCAPISVAVRPHAWKGGVPKDIHNKRVLAKLTADGLALVAAVKPAAKRHNAIDGVGLGQWYLEKHEILRTRF